MFLMRVRRLPKLLDFFNAELGLGDDLTFGEINNSGGNDFNMIRAFGHPSLHAAFNIGVIFQRLSKKTAVASLPVDAGPRTEDLGGERRADFGGGELAQAQTNLIFVPSVAHGDNSHSCQRAKTSFGILIKRLGILLLVVG